MDYYVKSVIPIIESNYENFTALERTIADFFMNHPYRYSHFNADLGDSVSSFINMRNHLKRKIKNSRDTQGRF